MTIKRSSLKKIIIVLLLCLLGAAVYLFIHRGEETTDDAAIDGRNMIVSPKVSGYVTVLNIDDNQRVKAGDVLLEIDPADYIIRRDRAKAVLDAANAQIVSSEALLQKAQSDLGRMQRLTDKARSQEQLDQVTQAQKSAQANYDQLSAASRQAAADLAQAEKDLADTKLIAPMDGIITKRGVERGNYVQPGQALSSLVGTDIWVTANFKETQLKHMHIGDVVDISVDAFPSMNLEGKIDSIQLGTGAYFSAFPPENATGNYVKIIQRVPVKIVITKMPDAKLYLGPGMSVTPVVYTGTGPEKAPENPPEKSHE